MCLDGVRAGDGGVIELFDDGEPGPLGEALDGVALAFLAVLVRADVVTALVSMMLWPPQSEHIAVFTSGKEPQGKTDVRTLSFLLLVAGALVATVAAAQAQILEKDTSVQIAGHLMRCSETPVVLDSNLPTEGMFIPGEAIYLNPQLMQHHPGSVRMFVFKHECAHKLVGGNELAADCSAAQAGAREHWLAQDGVNDVCQSLAGEPASDDHPDGRTRCANIRRCFISAQISTRTAEKNPGSQPFGSGLLKPSILTAWRAWELPPQPRLPDRRQVPR